MKNQHKSVLLIFFIPLLIIISGVYFYYTYHPSDKLLVVPIINRYSDPTPTVMPLKKFSTGKIFSYRNPENHTSGKSRDEYTLIATGDVIPARSVNATMVKLNNFNYPFEKTADFLGKSDIVFINLETPLIPGCVPTIEGMRFCGSEKAVEGLKYAHVRVASLANNHAGNYGNEGLNTTKDLLEKNGIAVTGIGKPAILTVRDKKFGFLGYNDIEKNESLSITLADKDRIATEVTQLKKQVDFVIVTFHFGIEYKLEPNERQKELAHATIDAGADLIIGNHPHWVEGVEIYKNKFITYAHGNFVFDQMWSQETREGVLGKYVFDKNGLIDVSFYPIIIENYSQPRFASEKEAEKILTRMREGTLLVY